MEDQDWEWVERKGEEALGFCMDAVFMLRKSLPSLAVILNMWFGFFSSLQTFLYTLSQSSLIAIVYLPLAANLFIFKIFLLHQILSFS